MVLSERSERKYIHFPSALQTGLIAVVAVRSERLDHACAHIQNLDARELVNGWLRICQPPRLSGDQRRSEKSPDMDCAICLSFRVLVSKTQSR